MNLGDQEKSIFGGGEPLKPFAHRVHIATALASRQDLGEDLRVGARSGADR
jgi:hypothetical protein